MSSNHNVNLTVNPGKKINPNSVGKIMCEMCGSNLAKYKCPKCLMQTCCLACVKLHKRKYSCDGKRNPGKFISIQEFKDRDLHRDYHFLEGVRQVAESSKRTLVNICGKAGSNGRRKKRKKMPHKSNSRTDVSSKSTPTTEESNTNVEASHKIVKQMNVVSEGSNEKTTVQKPKSSANDVTRLATLVEFASENSASIIRGTREKMLLNAAKERGINLILLSAAMERRKMNKSWFKKNVDKIFWKVKWTFMNVRDAPGSCASTGLTNTFGKKTGSNAAFFYQDSVDETVPLRECLSANFAVSVGNMNRRLTLRRFCTQDGCAEGLKFYLLKEGIAKSRKCGTDARVHLDGNKSLKSLLKGQIIVEFPQVLVYVSGEDESQV